MTTIPALLKVSLDTPVDFDFIKSVVGDAYKIGMVDYESFTARTTLAHILKNRDCVAILFHIKNPRTGSVTPTGHWTLLIKPSAANKNTYQFFDSLGLGLRKILLRTHESPFLMNLLKNKKWQDSTVALQKQAIHYKDCGAFVGVRGVFGDLTNKQFVGLFKGTKADKTVVTMTLLHYLRHEKVGYNKNDSKGKSNRR